MADAFRIPGPPGPWTEHAACVGIDPDIFFPPNGGEAFKSSARAKAICATCPVRSDCLDYAIRERITHGIWGGLTEKDRRVVRRQRREAA